MTVATTRPQNHPSPTSNSTSNSTQASKEVTLLPQTYTPPTSSSSSTSSITSTNFLSRKNDSNLNEIQLYHAYTLLLGHIASVRTLSGDVFEGVLHTIVPKQGVIVLKATIQSNKSVSHESRWKINSPGTTLILPLSQLVMLHVKNVGAEQGRQQKKGFQTDISISGAQTIKERFLEKWVSEDQTPNLGASLELDPAGDSNWNQFEVNKQKFGVTSNFQEDLYTTKLDRESELYKLREKEAIRLAKEIEQGSTSNPHLLEERNQEGINSLDEEDRYGAVLRTEKVTKQPKLDHRKSHFSYTSGGSHSKHSGQPTPIQNQQITPLSSSSSSSSSSTLISSTTSAASPSPATAPTSSQPNFEYAYPAGNQFYASHSHGNLPKHASAQVHPPHPPPAAPALLPPPQNHPYFYSSFQPTHPGLPSAYFPVQAPKPMLLMATEEYRKMLLLKRRPKEKEKPNQSEQFNPISFAQEVAKMPNFMWLPKHLLFSQYLQEPIDKRSFSEYINNEKLQMSANDSKEKMKIKMIESLKEFHKQFKLPSKKLFKAEEVGIMKSSTVSKPHQTFKKTLSSTVTSISSSASSSSSSIPPQKSGPHGKTNTNIMTSTQSTAHTSFSSNTHDRAVRMDRNSKSMHMRDSLPSKKDYHPNYTSSSYNPPSHTTLSTNVSTYPNRDKKAYINTPGQMPLSPASTSAPTAHGNYSSSPSSSTVPHFDTSPTKRLPPMASSSLPYSRHVPAMDNASGTNMNNQPMMIHNGGGAPRYQRDKKNVKHFLPSHASHSASSNMNPVSSASTLTSNQPAPLTPSISNLSSSSFTSSSSALTMTTSPSLSSSAFHLNVDAPVFVPSGPQISTPAVETKKMTSGFFAGKQLNMDTVSIKAQFRSPQITSNASSKDWYMGQPGKSYKTIAHVYPPPPPPNPYQIHPMYYYNRPNNAQPPPQPPPPTYFPVPLYPPTTMVPGPYPVTTPIMNYDSRQPPNYYHNPSGMLMPPPPTPPYVSGGMYLQAMPPPPPPHPNLPAPIPNPGISSSAQMAGNTPNTSKTTPSVHEN